MSRPIDFALDGSEVYRTRQQRGCARARDIAGVLRWLSWSLLLIEARVGCLGVRQTTAVYTMTIVDAAKTAQPCKAPLLTGSVEQMWKDFTAYRFGRRR